MYVLISFIFECRQMTLIMPSEYGMETLVGSSPILGSGFMGGPYFSSGDYPRCGGPVWSQSPPASSYGVSLGAGQQDFTPNLSRKNSVRRSQRKRKMANVTPPMLLNLKSCLINREEEQVGILLVCLFNLSDTKQHLYTSTRI